MSAIKPTVFCLFMLLAIPSIVCGQDSSLEEFVSREAIGFLVIEEPEALFSFAESCPFFSNPRFRRALEVLQDGETGLMDSDEVQQIEQGWSDFKDCFSGIDEISIVIYPPQTDGELFLLQNILEGSAEIPKFSIILTGDEDSCARLQRMFKNGQDQATKLLSLRLPDATAEAGDERQIELPEFQQENDESLDDPLMIFAENSNAVLKSFVAKRVDNNIVVSNDATRASQLTDRLSKLPNKKFRSLSKHRSYQRVRNLLDDCSTFGLVRGYFVPKNFPEIGVEVITDTLPFPPQTLRAGGFMLSPASEEVVATTGEGELRAVVEWDFVMTFSQPVTEFGKIIRSFRPLETLPALSHPIMDLEAISFDYQARRDAFNETVEIRRRKRQMSIADDTRIEVDDEEKVDQEEARQEEPNLAASVQQQPQWKDADVFGVVGQPEESEMDSIAGFANAHVNMLLGNQNASGVEGWVEMYAVDDFEAMEAFFMKRIDAENDYFEEEDRLNEVDNEYGRLFARSTEAARALALQAKEDDEDARAQLEIPESGPLPDSVMRYEFELFLNDRWMIDTDHVTMRRLLNSLHEAPEKSNAFDQIFAAAKKRNNDQRPVKVKFRHKGGQDSGDRAMQRYYIDKFERLGRNDELEDLLEAGPDEFGLFPLDSKQDAMVAVQKLLREAVDESFGTFIKMYAVEEGHLHVFTQAYSIANLTVGSP